MIPVLALLAPPLIGLLGFAGFIALAGGFEEFIFILHEGGFTTYIAIATAAMGAILIGIFSLMIAKGSRTPIAVPMLFALVPWAVGLLGMKVGLSLVEEALAAIDPSDARRIFVVGVAECFSARLVGAYASAILLFGLAASMLAAKKPTAAALALAAALFALFDVLAVRALSTALSATAKVSPDMIGAVLASAISEAGTWKMAMLASGAMVAIAAVAHAAISRNGDAVAMAVLAGAIIGLDMLAASSARSAAERMAVAPLASPELEPSEAPRADSGGHLDQVIDRSLKHQPFGGERAGIALDRRMTGEEVHRIASAFTAAGGKELALFGESRVLPEELLSRMGSDGVLFRPISHRRSSVALFFVDPAADPDLLHAQVTSSSTIGIEAKEGSAIEPFVIRFDEEAPERSGGGRYVFLTMSERATADDLLRAADALSLRELRPVLVRELPPIEIEGTETEPARPRVRGSLDPDAIRRVIQRNLGRIKVCYERELGRNPSLSGKVEVSMTIETNGRVSNASVAGSTIGDRSVEGCIVQTVKRLRFPRPSGGYVEVRYPFVFLPH